MGILHIKHHCDLQTHKINHSEFSNSVSRLSGTYKTGKINLKDTRPKIEECRSALIGLLHFNGFGTLPTIKPNSVAGCLAKTVGVQTSLGVLILEAF